MILDHVSIWNILEQWITVENCLEVLRWKIVTIQNVNERVFETCFTREDVIRVRLTNTKSSQCIKTLRSIWLTYNVSLFFGSSSKAWTSKFFGYWFSMRAIEKGVYSYHWDKIDFVWSYNKCLIVILTHKYSYIFQINISIYIIVHI